MAQLTGWLVLQRLNKARRVAWLSLNIGFQLMGFSLKKRDRVFYEIKVHDKIRLSAIKFKIPYNII